VKVKVNSHQGQGVGVDVTQPNADRLSINRTHIQFDLKYSLEDMKDL
jgi:hypothetical protein